MGTYKPDGMDMTAAIQGATVERTKSLYWEYRQPQAARWNDRSPWPRYAEETSNCLPIQTARVVNCMT